MAIRWKFLLFLLIIGSFRSLAMPPDDLPDNEVPPKKVNTSEIPYSEERILGVPSEKQRSTEGPSNEVPKISAPTTNVPPSKLTNTDVPTSDLLTTEVPTIGVPTTEVPTTELSTTEVPTTEPPNMKTVKGQMTVLIRDTEEVCNRIRNIDIYEKIVISTLPLRKSLSYQTRFNEYSEDYNRDLKAVKDHMNFWRKGNSIVVEMRSIYRLAKNFEDEFERKLAIYRERILRAPAESQKRRAELRREIENLKKAKDNLESKLISVNAAIKAYIQEEINEIQSGLEEKTNKEHSSTPLAMELEELVAFVGFVRDDAIIVKNKTKNVAKRLEELYNTIQMDNSTAFQYVAKITSDVDSLTSEKFELENTLAQENTKLRELEKQLEDLDVNKAKIRSALVKLDAELSDINSQMKKRRETFEKKREIRCHSGSPYMQTKPPSSWSRTLCDYILYVDGLSFDKEVEDLIEPKSGILINMQSYRAKEVKLQPQVNNITEEIRKVKDRMPEIKQRNREIKAELSQFNMFQSDVESLINGIKTALPYISETRKGLLTVQTTFEFVIGDIDNITGLAENANVEEERQEAKESVDEALKSLQEELSDSSKMMSDVDQCSMLASTVSI